MLYEFSTFSHFVQTIINQREDKKTENWRFLIFY